MLTLRTAAAGLLLAASSTAALADSYYEVESARANARAGGPVSERDAELLDRYGCLSGTRNSFCENQRYRHTERRHRDRSRDDR